ncbi:MAG: tetratricopeptide repeat protein [Gemmatimonadetes bacterium]|nr:tetratricopeptide repeat protein [Gemmatimonadota bacterium]
MIGIRWKILLLVLAATPVSAQERLPERPALPRGADPNSWESYFDLGMRLVPATPSKAEAAFYWASRLDPSRAEPLYGRWAAFHLKDIGRLERYLADDARVLARNDVLRADSLRWHAYRRNPFVHRGLDLVLLDQLPGRWGDDQATRAWISYGEANFARAAEHFGRIAGRSPRFAFWAVLANVSGGRYAEATVHLDSLLARTRREETRRLVRPDESKEMYEYALGLLLRAQNKNAEAAAALNRALLENLAFYPAWVQLGDMALKEGRIAEAVEQLQQAAEIAPEDGYLQYRLGEALLQSGKPAEAVSALRRASRLEPYHAAVDLLLGTALDRAGDTSAAKEAYTRYLLRAPAAARVEREHVERWLAQHPGGS